jgi:hypothetical protein
MHCEVVWREIGFANKFHQEQAENALPSELTLDYQSLSDWVHRLFQLYCDRVTVKVIDAASVEGFWKTLRYRLRSYPAVLIGGRAGFTGPDYSAADQEIDRLLSFTPGHG